MGHEKQIGARVSKNWVLKKMCPHRLVLALNNHAYGHNEPVDIYTVKPTV
jgi:hypothetical protein